MSAINYLTKESLEKTQAELVQLKTVGRANIAKAIAEAREKGDLKENAEYDAAKEAQGMHEAKIAQLESVLSNARVIDTASLDISKVAILTKVLIENMATNKEIEYQVVSENEADLKNKKLSVTSPIGKSLLGKAIGEAVTVQTPAGLLSFKIKNISI